MPTKSETKETRWTRMEGRVDDLERNSCTKTEMEKLGDRVMAGIKDLKDNDFAHLRSEIAEVKKSQEGHGKFQAELKGSINTLKWIIGIGLTLLGLAAAIFKA